MTDINLEIARLVQYGVKKGLLHQEDAVFAVNRILALLKLNDYTQAAVPDELCNGTDIVKVTFRLTVEDLIDSELIQLYPISIVKQILKQEDI